MQNDVLLSPCLLKLCKHHKRLYFTLYEKKSNPLYVVSSLVKGPIENFRPSPWRILITEDTEIPRGTNVIILQIIT